MAAETERVGIRLLVIDDDPGIRGGIRIALQQEVIEVSGAASGEEGIELARSMRPDLIILDVEMPPGIGGPEVCRRIRSEEALEDIPIIFLTAKVDLDAMEETVEEEAQGYLLKPFSEGDLLARSAPCWAGRSRPEELRARRSRASPRVSGLP